MTSQWVTFDRKPKYGWRQWMKLLFWMVGSKRLFKCGDAMRSPINRGRHQPALICFTAVHIAFFQIVLYVWHRNTLMRL